MAEQSLPRQDKLSLEEQLQNMHLGAPPAISNGATNIPTQEPGLLRFVDSECYSILCVKVFHNKRYLTCDLEFPNYYVILSSHLWPFGCLNFVL